MLTFPFPKVAFHLERSQLRLHECFVQNPDEVAGTSACPPLEEEKSCTGDTSEKAPCN